MKRTSDVYNLIKIFDGAKPHCYKRYYEWLHRNKGKVQIDYGDSEIGTYFRPNSLRRSIKITYRLTRNAKVNHSLGDVLYGE